MTAKAMSFPLRDRAFLSFLPCLVLAVLMCGTAIGRCSAQENAPDADFWKTSPHRYHALPALWVGWQSPYLLAADWVYRDTIAKRREEFWLTCPVPAHVAAVQVVAQTNPYAALAHRIYGKANITWGLEIPLDPPVLLQMNWIQSEYAPFAAAAQLTVLPDPFSVLAHRQFGAERASWGAEPHPHSLLAPPLNPILLDNIKDNTPSPNLRDKVRPEWTEVETAEVNLFSQALVNAHSAPPEAFAASAKGNEHITWGHLFNKPMNYKGMVVPIKGLLVRLRKAEAPLAARPHVTDYYEGWVQMETYGSTPVCVVFAHKPDHVPVAEILNEKIKFNGYFLKRYRYLTAGKGPRDTLLFLAPTFEAPKKAGIRLAPPFWDSLWSGGIIVLVVGVTAFLGFLLLRLWTWRHDNEVRRRLAAIEQKKYSATMENMGTIDTHIASNGNEAGYFTSMLEESPEADDKFTLMEPPRRDSSPEQDES
jgi:hypothetical protein